MITLFKVFMSQDVLEPINNVLMSGFITQGEQVNKFEQDLKKIFNHEYIVTLNSATSGLTLAIRMIRDKLNCTDEDEVLSTPLTCMATNLPIIANRLNVNWVDVDINTGMIDLESSLENTIKWTLDNQVWLKEDI